MITPAACSSIYIIRPALYICPLIRFSPFGQLQLARDADAEDSLTLSTAIWFAWGVLLNSGIGEGAYQFIFSLCDDISYDIPMLTDISDASVTP